MLHVFVDVNISSFFHIVRCAVY